MRCPGCGSGSFTTTLRGPDLNDATCNACGWTGEVYETEGKPETEEKPVTTNSKYPNLIPLDDWILIQRHDEADLSPGGIHIPLAQQDQSQLCTVVAVGPGKPTEVWREATKASLERSSDEPGRFRRRPIWPALKPGVQVLVGRNRGAEVNHRVRHEDGSYEDMVYYCVRESEVIALVGES